MTQDRLGGTDGGVWEKMVMLMQEVRITHALDFRDQEKGESEVVENWLRLKQHLIWTGHV